MALDARSLLALPLLLVAGCASARETYPGHGRADVWEAMVAVARTPSYDGREPSRRWAVRSNDVWVDEPGERIELHRWLVRDRSGPDVRPRREERRYRLRLELEPGDGEPTVRVTSLEPMIAAYVWDAADGYFDGVWEELGGTAPVE